jgi:hypothetical protein
VIGQFQILQIGIPLGKNYPRKICKLPKAHKLDSIMDKKTSNQIGLVG